MTALWWDVSLQPFPVWHVTTSAGDLIGYLGRRLCKTKDAVLQHVDVMCSCHFNSTVYLLLDSLNGDFSRSDTFVTNVISKSTIWNSYVTDSHSELIVTGNFDILKMAHLFTWGIYARHRILLLALCVPKKYWFIYEKYRLLWIFHSCSPVSLNMILLMFSNEFTLQI